MTFAEDKLEQAENVKRYQDATRDNKVSRQIQPMPSVAALLAARLICGVSPQGKV